MKKIYLIFLLISSITQAQKLYDYPLGVQAYTFRHQFPKDVEGTLDIIQKMGFTELESSGVKEMSLEQFREKCAERGISIPSSGASYDELVKNPQAVADRAKTLGAAFVMCAWIPHKGNDFTLDEVQNAAKVFNAAGKVLAENGITFCYHDHGYEFRPHEDGTLFDVLMKETNPAYVSFEMDVLWTLHGGADPVALLQKYPNRWKLMHVKDLRKGVVGDKSGHEPAENDVVLGTGQADWQAIITWAKKVGIQHCFIEDESDNELENVPKSLAFLKAL